MHPKPIRHIFLILPGPGGEPGIFFIFVYFLSTQQRLRPLNYCSPQMPLNLEYTSNSKRHKFLHSQISLKNALNVTMRCNFPTKQMFFKMNPRTYTAKVQQSQPLTAAHFYHIIKHHWTQEDFIQSFLLATCKTKTPLNLFYYIKEYSFTSKYIYSIN